VTYIKNNNKINPGTTKAGQNMHHSPKGKKKKVGTLQLNITKKPHILIHSKITWQVDPYTDTFKQSYHRQSIYW
jgi:hypothetical protein